MVPTCVSVSAGDDDLDELDELEGSARRLALDKIVETRVRDELRRVLVEAVQYVASSSRLPLVLDQVRYAIGIMQAEGETSSSIARHHGVSKQHVLQGAFKFARQFGFEPWCRRPESRQRMSERNYRAERLA